MVSRIGAFAWSTAKTYASKFTGALTRGLDSLATRAKAIISRKPG